MADTSKHIEGLSPELRELLEMVRANEFLPTGADNAWTGAQASDERKINFERFYNELSKQLDSTRFGSFSFFLNYGYVADESEQFSPIELSPEHVNQNSVKLVLEVIGDCNLKERRVLDVGCGRGGTIQVIHRFFQPASLTALDLSPNSIQFCRKFHSHTGATFHEGDAENLPFEDSTFEVVTNVESSHSYPNVGEFFKEVFRVLAPAGYFLYTDFMRRDKSNECVGILRNLGFEVEKDRDITRNVLLSCDQVAVSRVKAFRSGNENEAELMEHFLAAPGSPVYEGMKNGALIYRILKARKRSSP
jgi:SAM-dependent methyltransferase